MRVFSTQSSVVSRAARRPCRGGRLAFGLALLASLDLLTSGGAARAGDRPDGAAHRDLRHTVNARRALLRDPALGPLNLGVKVRDRVAVLWGPVPSQEVRRRALQVLRTVPDLLDVRDESHLDAPDDLAPEFLPEFAPAAPGFWREDSWRGQLTRRPDEPAPVTVPENVRFRPAPPAGDEPEPEGETVLPSVLVPAANAVATAAADLQEALDRLAASDRRFRGLRAEPRGAEVHIGGVAAHGEDLQAFARAAARLRGVGRVIIGEVRLDARYR
jgi:hypothetical protein